MALRPAPLSASFAAFVIGVGLLQTSASLPVHALLFLIIASGIWLTYLIQTKNRPSNILFLLLLLAALLCGYGYAAQRAVIRMADELPAMWEGKDIQIIGIIDELPTVSERGIRFSLSVEETITPGAAVPKRVALTWYRHNFDQSETVIPPGLRAGARWQLTVRLKRPHGNANPGGFDTEAWLLQHRWRATGYVRDAPDNMMHDAFVPSPMNYIQHMREIIRARIIATLEGKPYAGVIVALAIGEQRAIPAEQWQIFNRGGITHLVSISGLHVTIFSTLVGGLFFFLLRRSPRLTSRCPALKLAVLAGFCASAFYVVLAGAGIPAQRTLIMLAVAACGLWLQRSRQPFRIWLWALFIVVVWDPWAPLAPGFWLSFGAVGWLLYAAAGRFTITTPQANISYRAKKSCSFAVRTQWVVTLGLIPLLLTVFQQFSLVSLPANLWAIPWITLLVIPITLLGIIPGLSFLWIPAHFLTQVLMDTLAFFTQSPLAIWQQHGAPFWTTVASIIGVLWLLAPRGFPGRFLGVLWCLPALLMVPVKPPPEGGFDVTVLDVGQGLSVLVRTAKHTLLYDTGPAYNENSDAGIRVVAPFLQYHAIYRIDTMVISHADSDHAGGAYSIASALPITQYYISEENNATRLSAPTYCRAGHHWQWDGVFFEFISPDEHSIKKYSNANDRSCVLKVHTRGGSILLTGDIGANLERDLTQSPTTDLKSNIIITPHHGSKSSSSARFVDAVAPQYAVFSVGYRNRYHFPREEIVARYKTANAKILRTDQLGAILFQVRDRGIDVENYRQNTPRYWR